MEALIKFLQQFPHYRPELIENAKPFVSEKQIAAGEYFLREGQICKSIAFIEQGMFRLVYLHDGKEVTTCFCKENTLTCAYSSMITQKPSDLAIQAIEDSKIFIIPYTALEQLYAQDLFWQQVGRLAAESEYITAECHNRFLSDLSATERYLQILEEEPDLLQRVPLNNLASYLQVSPETLSRIRKKLSRT